MKIDLSQIDRSDFVVTPCVFANEQCYLVTPKNFPSWTKDNLIFRSSIWNSNGEPVSLSYKKFFNWEEAPHLVNKPSALKQDSELMEKLDGSTLIVSYYKGELIMRTRGTSHAVAHQNGFELEMLQEKYPKAFGQNDSSRSFIFEWVSPCQRIILNYGEEPDMYLTGIVNHSDYSLSSQKDLDNVAIDLGVKRPKRFNFSSIEEMLSGIESLKGQEGLCFYFNKGQDIRKVKSAWYLALHRMKTELGSYERVVDLYFALNQPNYTDFYNHVLTNFDYELAEQCKGHLSNVCDGMKEVHTIMKAMRAKADSLKGLPRKEAALTIISDYGQTNRSGMVFSYLDNKELGTNEIKKLLYQVNKL